MDVYLVRHTFAGQADAFCAKRIEFHIPKTNFRNFRSVDSQFQQKVLRDCP